VAPMRWSILTIPCRPVELLLCAQSRNESLAIRRIKRISVLGGQDIWVTGRRHFERRKWIVAVLVMRTRIAKPGQEPLVLEAIRRESAATFHRLAEAMGSAIFVCEGERLRCVNHAAETITEYTREELLTMNFGDLDCPGSGGLLVSRVPMRQEDAEFAPQV